MKTVRTLALVVALAVTACFGQSWTSLNHQPSFGAGAMLLMTDGTVLVHSEQLNSQNWYKLTPDASGSYINGAWSQIATMPAGYSPLYFGSAVLPDGRMTVIGGEYNNLQPVWTNLGAIYDPVANTWTSIAPPRGWNYIGDAQSVVLADGTLMQATCCYRTDGAALLNAKSLNWKKTGDNKFDVYDEEGWTLLPSGKVLTVDAYVGKYDPNGTGSEIYDPATGAWSNAGSTIVQLWDSCGGANGATYEVGPMVLRPDGTVFATGANACAAGHTSIYDTKTGTWTAGPDFPSIDGAADGPAALETNGKVLVMVSNKAFKHGAAFYEWDGSALTKTVSPLGGASDSSFYGHFLELPTGQILFSDFSSDIEVFTPAGTYNPAWQPTISVAPTSVAAGQSYTVSGTQFNGLSQGAAYGDDYQSATNYPLVRIVNNATGHVFYCRTHDHSTMGVATGSAKVSTVFDVPANIEKGASQLYVVANGIPSAAVAVAVQ